MEANYAIRYLKWSAGYQRRATNCKNYEVLPTGGCIWIESGLTRSGQREGSCHQQPEKSMQKAWYFGGMLGLKYTRCRLHGKAIKVYRV